MGKRGFAPGRHAARDKCIVNQFQSGLTLAEIGEKHGLTRSRIQQVLKQQGLARANGGKHVQLIQRSQTLREARSQRLSARFGHDLTSHLNIRANFGTQPVAAFSRQRNSAKWRGIVWQLTFAAWWAIWQASGLYYKRGCGHAKYVMSRIGDKGPYAVGNVFIQLADANTAQSAKAYWERLHNRTNGGICQENLQTCKPKGDNDMAELKAATATIEPIPVAPAAPTTVKVTHKLTEQLQALVDDIIGDLNDETNDAEDIIIEVEEKVLKLEEVLRKRGILNQEHGV